MRSSFSIASVYLTRLPLYLVWVVGIILAAIRWRRHPRTSLLMLMALIILLVVSLVASTLNAWLPFALARHADLRADRIGPILGLVSLGAALIDAVAWVLVLFAVFRRPGQGS